MKTSTTGNDFHTELLAAILNCGIQDISIIKEWQEKYQIDALQVVFELHYEYIHPDFHSILVGIASKRHELFLDDCEKDLQNQELYKLAEEELYVPTNYIECSYRYEHSKVQAMFDEYRANGYKALA